MTAYKILTKLMESETTWPLSYDADGTDFDDLVSMIKSDCAPFMRECKGEAMFRGFQHAERGKAYPIARIASIRKDRQPKDSDPSHHNTMFQMIRQLGLVANRDNAIFGSGDTHVAGSYGTVFAIFPIGQFNYTWSPYIGDGVDAPATAIFRKPEIPMLQWYLTPSDSKADYFPPGMLEDINTVFRAQCPEMHRQIDYYTSPEVWAASVEKMFDSENATLHMENMLFKKEHMLEMNKHERTFFVCTEVIERVKQTPTWVEGTALGYTPTDEQLDRVRSEIKNAARAVLDDYPIWQGDDGTLGNALESGNEVMIAGDKYLVVPHDTYTLIRDRLGMGRAK